MKNILNIIKNEFIKLFSEKKFWIFIGIAISLCLFSAFGYIDLKNQIIHGTAKASKLPTELKEAYLGINSQTFVILTSQEFILKSYLPLFLIFVTMIATSAFGADYLNGTMKFSLITPIKKSQLIIGKILYLLFAITLLILIDFALANIIGAIFFKKLPFDFAMFIRALKLYSYAILPSFAFGSIIAFLSIVIPSTSATLAIGIASTVILGLVDCVGKVKFFTPSGGIALLSDIICNPATSTESRKIATTAVAYIIIFIFATFKALNKKDILV